MTDPVRTLEQEVRGMTDELTDRELDEALHKLAGFEAANDAWPMWLKQDWVPRYSEDLTALIRDIWPVLQARGFDLVTLEVTGSGALAKVYKLSYFVEKVRVDTPTPALALSRAFYKALQEGK